MEGFWKASLKASQMIVAEVDEVQYVFLKRMCQVLVHLGTSQLGPLWVCISLQTKHVALPPPFCSIKILVQQKAYHVTFEWTVFASNHGINGQLVKWEHAEVCSVSSACPSF